jgi:hypothetical protein
MSVITRLSTDKLHSEKSGPEQYAPRNRRPLEKLSCVDQAANALEDEIRESLQHHASSPHQERSDAGPANDPAAKYLNELIHRVAGASTEEIDRVIFELQGVRNMLRNEGERLSHEVARYATLIHTSITAMKVIADSLKHTAQSDAAKRA